MPGLSGLIDTVKPLVGPDSLAERIDRVHALRGVKFHRKSYQTPHCLIVNTLTDIISSSLVQPAVSPDEDIVLFLDGEIYNSAALRRHLGRPEAPGAPTCQLLLDLYLRRGENFVTLLNGDFVVLIFHRRDRRLLVFNDHLATRPFYFSLQGTTLRFGSEKKPILATTEQKPALDPLGLLEVFAFAYNLGARTFIEGIESLTPASRLEYVNGRLLVSRYAPLGFGDRDLSRSPGDLIDEWCERMCRATERRLRGKERVNFGLSGGLDSRAVAVSVPRDFRPILAWTHGERTSLEVAYASRIARNLGFDHRVKEPHTTPITDFLHQSVWRTEGTMSVTMFLTITQHAELKRQGDFLLGGQLGDVASGGHLKPYMLLPRSRDAFRDAVFQNVPHYLAAKLRPIFNPAFLDRQLPLLKDAFDQSWAPLVGSSNPRIYESWDLFVRQPHMTCASSLVDRHLFGNIRPLFDREYLEFVMSLPTSLRFGQAMYQAVIHRLGPEIRHVPNANNNLLLQASIPGNRRNLVRDLLGKAHTRVMRKVIPGYRTQIEAARPHDRATTVRSDPELRRLLESFVNSPACDDAVFNKQGILRALEDHYCGAASYARRLCLLVTFAGAISMFLEGSCRECPPEAELLA